MKSAGRISDARLEAPLPAGAGLLKLIFQRESRTLLGVHCIGDIASEIVGIGQMVIRCGGTLHTIANMSMNTPTYAYAYKYAAFDGLRRVAAPGKESHDESARRLSPIL
jgi:NAD(P) transhydrogenase